MDVIFFGGRSDRKSIIRNLAILEGQIMEKQYRTVDEYGYDYLESVPVGFHPNPYRAWQLENYYRTCLEKQRREWFINWGGAEHQHSIRHYKQNTSGVLVQGIRRRTDW